MFNRWRNYRGKILGTITVLLVIAILTAPYVALQYLIPNNMSFLLGREHKLSYFLPLQAEIRVSEEELILVDQSPIKPREDIDISRPVSVKFSEQGNYTIDVKLFGIPIKSVDVEVIDVSELIPCGRTIGVEMDTNGVLVLGLGAVKGIDGKSYQPSKGRLYTGDLIIEVNGQFLKDQEQLKKAVEESEGRQVKLKINRYGTEKSLDIKPIKSKVDGQYRLGIWTRDDTQGIGTITYINPKTNSYGALGHGITDIDTRELMPLRNGKITYADILSIKKGEKGSPGEIEGVILGGTNNILGDVQVNSSEGIYGKISNKNFKLLNGKPIPVAFQQDVIAGEAYILSDVGGNDIEKYDIKVSKVSNFNTSNSKGMIVEIIDEKLLGKTNGIIQGMSGSPIIQNGKIIGAVTHVFVQNPTKGYGIYIENMLKKEKLVE